jgi:hypothetical protein
VRVIARDGGIHGCAICMGCPFSGLGSSEEMVQGERSTAGVGWAIPALGALGTLVRGPQAVVLLVGLPFLRPLAFELRD